jgi:hypothetical protein
MILRKDLGGLRARLVPWLAKSVDDQELTAACATIVADDAGPVAVRSASELRLPDGEPEDFDAIVQVVVETADQVPCGMLEFYLDAAHGHFIVCWDVWRFAGGDPQRGKLVARIAPRIETTAL